MKTRFTAITVIISVLFVAGCATEQAAICFAPTGSFQPETGKDLLNEINRHVPFEIQPEEFICRVKYDRLIGWALIPGEQKETVKENLASSGTLNILQVEEASEEFKTTVKNWWKASQTVKVNAEK
jgi:hypothetical protein